MALVLAGPAVAAWAQPATAPGPTGALSPGPALVPDWQPWQSLAGVVDVVGPRPDRTLVAAAAGKLVLVTPDGTKTPFGTYATDPGPESYIALSPGVPVAGAGCGWQPGEVFALELANAPLGVVRVSNQGQPSRFVDTPQVESLTGIAFDATGRFDYALLVAGRKANRTVVLSIDCQGRVRTLTQDAPVIEGGMAVAPQTFGDHGGDLIGVDENTGDVIFIRYDGTSGVLLNSGLPTGGDVGVESLGFVPKDFVARGGTAYLADRRSPGAPTAPPGGSPPTVPPGGSPPTVPLGGSSPTQGTDTIWRYDGATLNAAGVDDNDLLVATEGGGRTIIVRCRMTCRVLALGSAPGAHAEGHITVVVEPPPPPHPLTERANSIGTLVFWALTAVVVAGGFILFFVHDKRREPTGS